MLSQTVTVEVHPYLGIPHASIHPCKHAAVMKKIVDQLNAAATTAATQQQTSTNHSDSDTTTNTMTMNTTMNTATTTSSIDVSQYLFIFLKFMSSVIPTI